MSSLSELGIGFGHRLRLNGRTGAVGQLVPARFRRDGMVVAGRRGRLFLAADTAGTIEQHTGRRLLSDAELTAWHDQLETRTARLQAEGRPYVMLIAPNAHAVYEEDLPGGVVTARGRPVRQLLDHLAAHDAPTPVLYPLAELLVQKARGEVYPRTDSHWNEFGAFAAYTRLADELDGRVPMRRVGEDDFLFVSGKTRGDLGYKRRWTRRSDLVAALARHTTVRLVEENMVENTGRRVVTECRSAPAGSCLVFGDSYSFGLLPFLAESFRRLVLLHHPAVDWEVVGEEQPSVVLTVMCERFLATRQEDHDGRFAVTVQSKLAEGRIEPLFNRWEHGPSHVAPADVEAMRASLRREGRLRAATLLSAIAYGGLWPAELHRLRWRDVGATTIHVRPGSRREGRGSWPREVTMLAPLAADLLEWRRRNGPLPDRDLVFPPIAPGGWGRGEWREWVRERYQPLAAEQGLSILEPTRLRETFIALLIQEGATLEELLSQVGGPRKDVKLVYGGQIRAAARCGYVSAEAQVERARRQATTLVQAFQQA